ncbi:MAG: alanine--tRNA ligase-related protein, partial [Parcubacteria group bacterium]
GGYWKKDAIEYAHEFITKEMNLEIDYVSVFEGEADVPRDTESEEIWKSIDPSIKIIRAGRKDNFWGPTGEEGPCGPTTEIYVNGMEVWNIVFNEFYQNKDKSLRPLEIKGIDTGMGLERLAMVSQMVPTVFDTDLFDFAANPNSKEARIVADHMRASVFMIADGVTPSNTERGYVLRRLIRRVVRFVTNMDEMAENILDKYKDIYTELDKSGIIFDELRLEDQKFRKTLDAGIKQFEKGEDPFVLFTTYGFPFELTKELAKEKGQEVNDEDFNRKFLEHQKTSKAGMEQKFKGGLAGHSEMEIRYHTATHLLHQALREVLGQEVQQKGSNITPERLRFDFAFPRKMTDGEKKDVEEIVNSKIREALQVNNVVLPKEEALETGALHFFGDKYGESVSIYFIGESLEGAYSKEFCGGPHVGNTQELGQFKISKEEAISAGTRRIKAILL